MQLRCCILMWACLHQYVVVAAAPLSPGTMLHREWVNGVAKYFPRKRRTTEVWEGQHCLQGGRGVTSHCACCNHPLTCVLLAKYVPSPVAIITMNPCNHNIHRPLSFSSGMSLVGVWFLRLTKCTVRLSVCHTQTEYVFQFLMTIRLRLSVFHA